MGMITLTAFDFRLFDRLHFAALVMFSMGG